MFDLPRDTPMLLNSPARLVAAEANGPQSQVHAGASEGQQADDDDAPFPMIAGLPERLWDAVVGMAMVHLSERAYLTQTAVEGIYAAAVELANAEPSVPILVAEKRQMTCHEYLGLQDRRPTRGVPTKDAI